MRKIILFSIGVLGVGVSLAFIIAANLGYDPLSALTNAIALEIGMDISLVLLIANSICLYTHYVRFNNIRFTILGFIASSAVSGILFLVSLGLANIPADNIAVQIIYLAIGYCLLAFSIACVLAAEFQKLAFEAFQATFADIFKKNINFIRVIVEVSLVALAAVLYYVTDATAVFFEAINVGTIIMMLGTGPLIELFYRLIRRKLNDKS